MEVILVQVRYLCKPLLEVHTIPICSLREFSVLVTPVPQQRFREISQKHEAIEEASKSNFACGYLTERMQAELVPLDPQAWGATRHHHDDIQELSSHQEVKWSWGINARQAGNPEVCLLLKYELSPEGQEFRSIPHSPVYEERIRVPAQPWWQRIFGA